MCPVRLLWRWPLPKIHRPCPTGLQAQDCFWGSPVDWPNSPCWLGWCELKICLHFELFSILRIALETATWALREWQLRATSILQPPAVKDSISFLYYHTTWYNRTVFISSHHEFGLGRVYEARGATLKGNDPRDFRCLESQCLWFLAWQ